MINLVINIVNCLGNETPEMSVLNILMIFGALGFLLLISKILRNKPIQFPLVNEFMLEQYTLGIEETYTKTKKLSFVAKLIVFTMCLILIFTPLEELLSPMGRYFY